MLWYAAGDFGDEGAKFRSQVQKSLASAWRLGVERKDGPPGFASVFCAWASK